MSPLLNSPAGPHGGCFSVSDTYETGQYVCGNNWDIFSAESVGTYTMGVQCYPCALIATCTNCFTCAVQQYLQWLISWPQLDWSCHVVCLHSTKETFKTLNTFQSLTTITFTILRCRKKVALLSFPLHNFARPPCFLFMVGC